MQAHEIVVVFFNVSVRLDFRNEELANRECYVCRFEWITSGLEKRFSSFWIPKHIIVIENTL